MLQTQEFKIIHENNKSNYDWLNIEHNNFRIGKIRCKINENAMIIYSINIFPEFQNNGFGTKIIKLFKERFEIIKADRVRHTAEAFWTKVSFSDTNNGDFIWKRN